MPGGEKKADPLPPTAIFAMLSTIIVKGIIWIGCSRVESKQVAALSQGMWLPFPRWLKYDCAYETDETTVDCKTDVFFNSLSLAFPYIGYKANLWWLDPAGAGVLSLYIIYDWASTCLENVTKLTGIGVDDELLKKLIFLAWRFSPIVDGYKVRSATAILKWAFLTSTQ